MSYNQKELAIIRYHADELACKVLIAYWVEEGNKKHHIVRSTEILAQLADAMGYDITKREKPVETEAA
jgi:DhnA family fructose-bisphosphate aldolase class Ia